jgi:hypothetical protein
LVFAANAGAATLTVQQDSLPNGAGAFDYAAGGGLSPASFQLDDDGINSNGLKNFRTF